MKNDNLSLILKCWIFTVLIMLASLIMTGYFEEKPLQEEVIVKQQNAGKVSLLNSHL